LYPFHSLATVFLHLFFHNSLAHHYGHCHGKRPLAFKYRVKAADQAISRGAFSDGLRFAQNASKNAVNKEELKILLMVISRALRDITATAEGGGVNGSGGMSVKRLSLSYSNNQDMEQFHTRVTSYLKLKMETESALERLSKGHITPGEVTPGNRNRLVIQKQHTVKLTWQPSYVASKMAEDSSSDEEDEETEKKSFCTVS
jgi:hypothetical protein